MNITTLQKIQILQQTINALCDYDSILGFNKHEVEIALLEDIQNSLYKTIKPINQIEIIIKTKIGTYVSRRMERDYRFISEQTLKENSEIFNLKFGSKMQETEEHEEGERLVTILKMDLEVGAIFKVNFNKYEEIEGLDRKTSFYGRVTAGGYEIISQSQAVKALEELERS